MLGDVVREPVGVRNRDVGVRIRTPAADRDADDEGRACGWWSTESLSLPHSARSVLAGSTRAARRAGIQLAASAAVASAAPAPASTPGSVADTP